MLPSGTDEKNNSGGHASVMWENVDCVLSQDKLKSLSAAYELEQQQKHQNIKAASDAGSSNSSKMRSIRRTSTPGTDDFNWMRKLVLRSDVPTIDEIRNWNFDPLMFEDIVLVQVFLLMLEYYNLMEEFQLNRSTLERYATAVMNMHNQDCYYQQTDIDIDADIKNEGKVNESGQYSDEHVVLCEYHNWYHAVSCAHASFLFLTLGEADQLLEPKDIFSIIMGALIHDLDHPGTNNDFEVKRATELARRYDNDAVLERHSISEGLKLCKESPDLDWLKSFENLDDREYIEHFITESVLATDPARHGVILREAISFLEEGPKIYGGSEPSFFSSKNPEHRLFIGRLFLHSADIVNPVHSSFDVARDWAVRVTTEFTRQAAKEKELQLPVTSFMEGLDNEYNIAKVQISFFGFMVQPLYQAVGQLFPKLSHLNGWGEKNCEGYREVIKAVESKQKETM